MPKARKRTEPPPPARKNFAEVRLLPFLDRYSLLFAILAVALAVARIVSTYHDLSVTTDEPGHFGCGLQYVAQHIYTYETQHPPLARAMTAVVPYLEGVRPLGDPNRNTEGYRLLAKWGPDRLLTWMRLGILPFFLLACAVVYIWARHFFGRAAGFFSVAFFTLVPQVLADAGLATTDMGLAACVGAAYLALLLWAESPTWPRSILLGLASAAAALSKFTALGFLPAAVAFAILGYLALERPGFVQLLRAVRIRLLPFAVAVAVGALAVWAAYFFSYGEAAGWDSPVPAPGFFDGIHSALEHNTGGHLAYLFHRFSNDGWWYYFPVAIAVKTPIPLLALAAAGIALAFTRRLRPLYLPLALVLGVLIPSMTSHVNIGLRHILPVYLALPVIAAAIVVDLIRRVDTPAVAASLALLPLGWMAASGAAVHPDYLAYFNAFAGSHPENILLDSNYDWSQDWKRLALRLRELHIQHPHAYGLEDLGLYPTVQGLYGLPDYLPVNPGHPDQPDPGWTIVRISADIYRPDLPVVSTPQGFQIVDSWYHHATPKEKIGGFLLFYSPPRP